MKGRRNVIGIASMAVVLVLGACDSSSSSSTSSTTSTTAGREAGEEHEPEGSARVFCNPQLQREIGTSLGVAPVRVTEPRVTDRVYSCQYEFANGSMPLSVTTFPTVAAAKESTADIARTHGRRPEAPGLGEGLEAFLTTDGSMIVRNKNEVLDVDVAALPSEFGEPPQPRSVIALAAAVTIVGHWEPG